MSCGFRLHFLRCWCWCCFLCFFQHTILIYICRLCKRVLLQFSHHFVCYCWPKTIFVCLVYLPIKFSATTYYYSLVLVLDFFSSSLLLIHHSSFSHCHGIHSLAILFTSISYSSVTHSFTSLHFTSFRFCTRKIISVFFTVCTCSMWVSEWMNVCEYMCVFIC